MTRTVHPVERKIKYFNRMCLHDYARIKDGGKRLVKIPNLGAYFRSLAGRGGVGLCLGKQGRGGVSGPCPSI